MPKKQEKSGVLYQVGTHFSLLKGVYHGEVTIAELAKQGDFGLGTFDNINGEMAAFDGTFFKTEVDGKLKIAKPDDITTFAHITYFNPTGKLIIKNINNYDALVTAIIKQLPNKNIPYALRFDTVCDYVKFFVVPEQKKPYPPIEHVLKTKAVFEKKNVAGTCMGFLVPNYFAPAVKIGLHLRFIDNARTTGGHIGDIVFKEAIISYQPIYDIHIHLPSLDDFAEADFTS